MNHGQFYKAGELVATSTGMPAGSLPVFAPHTRSGASTPGTFTATPVAKTLSRAIHFQGTPMPAHCAALRRIRRPEPEAVEHVAMATKFYLPDGKAAAAVRLAKVLRHSG